MTTKKRWIIVFVIVIVLSLSFFWFMSLSNGTQDERIPSEVEKNRITEIEKHANEITTYQDLFVLEDELSKMGAGDSRSDDFLRIEEMTVNRIVSLIAIGDHKQIEVFFRASSHKSTSNLLLINLFDKGKLSSSKKDILFGASLLGGYEQENRYHDFLHRKKLQELLLNKIKESAEVFSTLKLLSLFDEISLNKKKSADFLDQYILRIRPTKK